MTERQQASSRLFGSGTRRRVLAIEEIEGDDVDAARRQSGGKAHHEGARLVRPRAMPEDQRDARRGSPAGAR